MKISDADKKMKDTYKDVIPYKEYITKVSGLSPVVDPTL